jgi:hypothetical protein
MPESAAVVKRKSTEFRDVVFCDSEPPASAGAGGGLAYPPPADAGGSLSQDSRGSIPGCLCTLSVNGYPRPGERD